MYIVAHKMFHLPLHSSTFIVVVVPCLCFVNTECEIKRMQKLQMCANLSISSQDVRAADV